MGISDKILSAPIPLMMYMPTICADMGVTMRSQDGLVAVNLIVFQQAECCTAYNQEDNGKIAEALSRGETSCQLKIRPEEFRRQLQYWTQRIAMARGGDGPIGLYDATVREQFNAYLNDAYSIGLAAR